MAPKGPKYCRQKRPAGDIAFVKIRGKRVYLGTFGSSESRERYDYLIEAWKADPETFPEEAALQISRSVQRYQTLKYEVRPEDDVPPQDLTVAELIHMFWRHAEEYYRHPDGTPTGTAENFRLALRPLRRLYGMSTAKDFSPRRLKRVRELFIEQGASRSHVNGCVSKIRQAYRWAVEEELVPVEVLTSLQAVRALKRGRTKARETEPVRPVLQDHVDAVRPFVSRQVWAMVQIQLLTGARSGEVVQMRAVDIDMSGPIWLYGPQSHKTEHHGHERIIYLGPKAQQVVRPFLKDRPLDVYLFRPKDAESERLALMNGARSP